MSYFEVHKSTQHTVDYPYIYGLRKSEGAVLQLYPKKFRQDIVQIISETLVECSNILDIDIPVIVILTKKSYRKFKKKSGINNFAMISFPAMQIEGEDYPAYIWIDPQATNYTQKVNKWRRGSEFILRSQIAHEMYHHYVFNSFPTQSRRLRDKENDPARSFEVWNRDRTEYACNLFSLGYLRTRKAEKNIDMQGKKLAEEYVERMVSEYTKTRRGKTE